MRRHQGDVSPSPRGSPRTQTMHVAMGKGRGAGQPPNRRKCKGGSAATAAHLTTASFVSGLLVCRSGGMTVAGCCGGACVRRGRGEESSSVTQAWYQVHKQPPRVRSSRVRTACSDAVPCAHPNLPPGPSRPWPALTHRHLDCCAAVSTACVCQSDHPHADTACYCDPSTDAAGCALVLQSAAQWDHACWSMPTRGSCLWRTVALPCQEVGGQIWVQCQVAFARSEAQRGGRWPADNAQTRSWLTGSRMSGLNSTACKLAANNDRNTNVTAMKSDRMDLAPCNTRCQRTGCLTASVTHMCPFNEGLASPSWVRRYGLPLECTRCIGGAGEWPKEQPPASRTWGGGVWAHFVYTTECAYKEARQ